MNLKVMFINVNSVSSPTPTSRVPNAAFWVTLHGIKCKEALTLLHLKNLFAIFTIFCKIYAGMLFSEINCVKLFSVCR
ncbi:hypothetical protein NP493_79g00015 [Ridgeia piscesae]|uniref:Uncharacterized protein n=1 Tax=Ridgeia piscesae TaxID=27915 RepID=A0AAD9P8U4_RIDPI|nr:hypothetical protein NP493_79g00015 [Ridgeia piscesae]